MKFKRRRDDLEETSGEVKAVIAAVIFTAAMRPLLLRTLIKLRVYCA